MKQLVLFLTFVLSFTTVNAQYYYHERYVCDPYVDRVYRVAPVHMTVRKSPKVIVVEEEENIIYYHKKKEPQVTHIYEDCGNKPFNTNCTDELINVDDTSTLYYNEMWKQTIWFSEDSYRINKEYNKITLDNIASFLKEHPSSCITIYGYASKRHGSYEYNKHLAANRCRNTKEYLMNVYNISHNRLKLCVRGTDTPEYYVDKWNQCVIIKCDNIYE